MTLVLNVFGEHPCDVAVRIVVHGANVSPVARRLVLQLREMENPVDLMGANCFGFGSHGTESGGLAKMDILRS